jgi:diadenosine tetraphosphatase ApaH/serine/threonine PP2A family protein phosphatase
LATAIISDIHANLEALTIVLDDIKKRGIEDIVCLGDIIGYGPNPLECLDVAMGFRWSLMGNHEEAVLYGAVGFNPKAKMAIDWTRDQLNLASEPADKRNKRWKFLGELRNSMEDMTLEFVHGSPRDPVREYIFPTDVLDHEKLRSVFEHVHRACLMGHTHLPGVITESGKFVPPKEDGFSYEIPESGEKILLNVGSVGQPRDGDYRACYVTWADRTITWHRLDYDVEKTAEKILKTDRLPAYLASRLREGR